MEKTLIISILSLLFLSGCSISGTQNTSLNIIYEKQKQFDSLEDDVVFSHQQVKRQTMDITITGRSSIHDFPTLGIKVYSDDPHSDSFKTEFPFIIKNGNMLIDRFSPIQYIEAIAKYPNEDMKNIYEGEYLKQFGTGCYTSIETGNSLYFTGKSAHNIDIYYATSISGGYICYVGKPDTERYIRIFYNKERTDRYYVVHFGDGCAPGKCNVFNNIELY